MSIEEAKLLYPGRQDYQFNPLLNISVGDRVCWLNFYKEKEEGIVIFFTQWSGVKPMPPDWKVDPDFTSVTLHMDDGTKTRKMLWDISKITTPETATGGEGDKQAQNGSN
jgi:hypothetical protein